MARCPTLTICWVLTGLAAAVPLTVGGCITPVQVSSVEDAAETSAHPSGPVPTTVGAEPVRYCALKSI
jgi:hypothetical protein